MAALPDNRLMPLLYCMLLHVLTGAASSNQGASAGTLWQAGHNEGAAGWATHMLHIMYCLQGMLVAAATDVQSVYS
jgi:hypothetical protein